MSKILGVLLCIIGIAVGLYIGIWVMFIGGVLGLADVVDDLFEGNELDGTLVAWSVLKMMFAGFTGYVSALALIFPGVKILSKRVL